MTAPSTKNRPRHPWSAGLWVGCDVGTWFRRLAENRYAVDWCVVPWLPLITLASLEFTFLRNFQRRIYGRRIDGTPLRPDPIFVIGHWRSGTTLLHELLALDERHAYPTTFECIAPLHCVLTRRLAMRWLSRFVPKTRPMDNMALGWDRPQEDEFALVGMGLPSPYLMCAFPRRGPVYGEYLELDDVPPKDLENWKRLFVQFLKQVAYRDPRRLILKSPTHTFRIRTMLELFREARFIHIVRDPYVVFASTVHLWKTLQDLYALQAPTHTWLEEYVLETYLRLFRRLDETRSLVPAGRFAELRYEDLVRDPVATLRATYDQLDLGEFEHVAPAIERYAAEAADYQTNRYELPPALRERITRRWGDVIRRYGYASEPAVAP